MNRSQRRATRLPQRPTPRIMVRQRPALSGRICEEAPFECSELHPAWRAFYLRWIDLFRVLDRPIKWVAVVVLLVVSAFLIGRII